MLLSKSFLISGMILLSAFLSNSVFANDSRSAQLFKLCTACHGMDGEGKVSLATPAIAGMDEWYLTRQLSNFKNDVRGKHPKDLGGLRMRPMARTLQTEADIKLVSAYVSKLPKQAVKKTVKGNVVDGETAYAVCSACHGVDGKGNQALNAPSLTVADDWYLLTQLKNFKNGARGGDPAKDPIGASMAGMAGTLSEKAMMDVVSYIQTMKEKGKK